MAGASYNDDEAFDEDDVCVDGEAEVKQNGNALIEARSFCPSTDLIIVLENPGKFKYMTCGEFALSSGGERLS